MFGGGSPGLLGEENKPKLFPPMSREPEFEGTGDESCGCDQRRRFRPWQGCRISARFRGETERGTSVREKERDAGKGVARSEKTAKLGNRR